MPTDTTYIHVIDVIAAHGPAWLLAAGVLSPIASIVIRAYILRSSF